MGAYANMKEIAGKEATTEEDDRIVESVARSLGFASARVVCGVVYLDGQGTIKNPPVPVQAFCAYTIQAIQESL